MPKVIQLINGKARVQSLISIVERRDIRLSGLTW